MSTQNTLFDPTTTELLQGVHSGDAPKSLFINGQWEAAQDGETRTIVCPADGSTVGVVSEASEADTLRAIQIARETFDKGEWAATPSAERGKIVIRLADFIREHKELFAQAESADTGKRYEESLGDMDDIANAFEYFGTLAQHQAGRVVDPQDPNLRSRIDAEPVGVCGLITPGITRCCRCPGRLAQHLLPAIPSCSSKRN